MAVTIVKKLTIVTASAAFSLLVIDACPASAVTFTVGDTTSLINAINAANSSSDDDIISFINSITLTSQLPLIGNPTSGSFNFDGMSNTLNGGGQFQGFFVNSGTVSLNNLTITNGLARGGNGGSGGGGGAGLGGGLFINSGTVTVDSVTFSQNQAIGGSGGDIRGGGGLGGSFNSGGDGGGGGGSGGDGSNRGGGAGLGGAIFINSGSLTLSNSTFLGNAALGGDGFNNGQGKGGAIFINQGATATSFGQLTFTGNTASDDLGTATDNDNVFGSLGVNTTPVPVPGSEISPLMSLLTLGAWGAWQQRLRLMRKRRVSGSTFSNKK